MQVPAEDDIQLVRTIDALTPMLLGLFNMLQALNKEQVGQSANIDFIRPWPQWFSQT